MNISDETLSAFLDQQLPPLEQARIIQQLVVDVALQQRVGQLHAQQMALVLLSTEIDRETSVDTQISEPLLPKSRTTTQRVPGPGYGWLSLAASVAMLAGIAIGTLGTPQKTEGAETIWPAVNHYLAEQPGGHYSLTDAELFLHFSFKDSQQRYCRVYDVVQKHWSSNQIACHTGDQWQLVFSAGQKVDPTVAYQAASGREILDKIINQLMLGEPLSAVEELQRINDGWR